jgi:hypothetical protein
VYALLRRHLPRRWANAVALLWYTALLVLIYGLWGAPQAAFRYIAL